MFFPSSSPFHFQSHPLACVFAVSALVAMGIAFKAGQKRSAPGALSLFAHMLAVAYWSLSYAFLWAAATRAGQVFWLNAAALGIVAVPVTFLVFSLQVTHHERLLARPVILLLCVEPVLALFLTWTNDRHHLVYRSIQVWVDNGLYQLVWLPGGFMKANAIYSYLLLIVGMAFLVRALWGGTYLLRSQVQAILAGACLSLGTNALSFTLLVSAGHWDPAPLAFTVSGLVYFYALTRLKLLDLTPVERHRLIEVITDGVIVLDAQDRIVDLNPAAEKFLGLTALNCVGQKAPLLLSSWEERTKPFWSRPEVRTEIVCSTDPPRYLDINITPFYDRRNSFCGRVIVFRDITARKQNEAALQEANRQLQEQLAEIRALRDELREQATRDPLTNLYNRRYLEERMTQELSRAQREEYPVSVIMMDIDHFKRVNDTCGHKVGDEILQALAHLLVTNIRRFDAACRYGGEEFVILMPHISEEKACERADGIRREFLSVQIPDLCEKARPTLSFGVAAYPFHGRGEEELLKAADVALYAAKSAGGNRGLIYSESMAGK